MAKYKSDINLFDCIFKDKTKKAVNLEKEIKKSLLAFAGIAVACAVIGGISVGAQKTMLEVTKANTEKLKAKFDFDDIAKKKAECDKLTADNQKIRNELAIFESSPQFKTELFGYIAAAQPENVVINVIKYSESVITLECTGPEQLTGATFAARLRDEVTKDKETGEERKLFKDVDYTGTSSKDGVNWGFTLKITLVDKAAEAKAAAEAQAKAAAEAQSETTTKEA